VLGETWVERGDAPEYERLYARREPYRIGTVPRGVKFLTAGVDVQKDRLVYEVVGWSLSRESWSIDAGVFVGDTSAPEVWAQLDSLVSREFPGDEGAQSISMLAVDSGFNTQQVYAWARKHPMNRVIAVKGEDTAKVIISTPTKVDVTIRGKRIGYKKWGVGSHIAKGELYGWLRLERGEDGFPPGFCHFPEYGEEYFRQLTSEHLVSEKDRRGFTRYIWKMLPGRENHFLDCRVYARAAAALLGVDRAIPEKPRAAPAQSTAQPVAPPARAETAARPARPQRSGGGFLGRGKGWLR
jgi:phage terminase large subunit GpA-like protein